MGKPRALFLLGYHHIEAGLEPIPCRRYGVLPVKVRDGALKLSAIVPELERGQGVERVLGRIDGNGLGSHRRHVLTARGHGVSAIHRARAGLPLEASDA